MRIIDLLLFLRLSLLMVNNAKKNMKLLQISCACALFIMEYLPSEHESFIHICIKDDCYLWD